MINNLWFGDIFLGLWILIIFLIVIETMMILFFKPKLLIIKEKIYPYLNEKEQSKIFSCTIPLILAAPISTMQILSFYLIFKSYKNSRTRFIHDLIINQIQTSEAKFLKIHFFLILLLSLLMIILIIMFLSFKFL